jgi:hypothetical protein
MMVKAKKYGKLHNERSMMAVQPPYSRRQEYLASKSNERNIVYAQQGQVFVTGKGFSRGNRPENSYVPVQEVIHGFTCMKFHSGNIQLVFRRALRNFRFIKNNGKYACQLIPSGMIVSH